MRDQYRRQRDGFIRAFEDLGIPVAIPQGSFFMVANLDNLAIPMIPGPSEEEPGKMENYDYALCRWLTTEIGITLIPPSAFFAAENAGMSKTWVRICFAKTEETLEETKRRLAKLRPFLKPAPCKL
jgi:aspartate/methionine/tyrosine aminotransferase